MVSQSMPTSSRMASPCSLNSGARRTGAGSPPNCTGAATSLNGVPPAGLALLHVPVGDALRVDRALERVLHHAPLAGEVGQPLAPLGHRALGEGHLEERLRLQAVLDQRRVVGEARVGPELGPPDGVAELDPVPAGLQAAEGERALVLGLVVAHQGVQPRRVGRRAAPGRVADEREREGLAHGPHPRAEQRDVDRRGLTRALPVEQRAHDAAGDGHGPDGVPEARRGWADEPVGVRRLRPEGDAGPEPERQGVVGALVGVGATLALPGARDVDDVGVVRPDVLGLDAELLAHPRQLVGQEDVRRAGELVEDLEALGGGEVEGQAALAAVRVLEQCVDVAGDRHHARGGQAAHGVAALDRLDLDHVGAPVGQERRGRRHEGVLGHFEDADALHHCGHRKPPSVRPARA